MHKIVKKPTRKRNIQFNKHHAFLLALVLAVGGFLYTFVSLQSHLSDIRKQREAYDKEIAAQEEIYEDLQQSKENNSTEESYEKKARDEGYVGEDEVVFVIVN